MNKIMVYYTKIDPIAIGSNFLKHLNSLPVCLHEKILKTNHKQTRYSRLFGLLLLQHGLKSERGNEQILTKLEYTIKGKPYISGADKFNISHSGNLVVCVFSKSEVGIDIEKIRNINIENFRLYFSNNEYVNLEKSLNINKLFFQYWTKKESFAKAISEGLTISFADITFNNNTINYNNQNWFSHELDICNDYIANICTQEQYPDIEMKEIVF